MTPQLPPEQLKQVQIRQYKTLLDKWAFLSDMTPEQLMIEQYQKHDGDLRRISKALGVTTVTTARYLKRAGITVIRKPCRNPRPRQEIQAILDDHDCPHLGAVIQHYATDGYGSQVIADILGLARSTIVENAQKYNVTLPKRTRKDLQASRPMPATCLAAAQEKNTRWFEYKGERRSLQSLAAERGISPQSLSDRVKKWGLDKAMATPKLRNSGRRPATTN